MVCCLTCSIGLSVCFNRALQVSRTAAVSVMSEVLMGSSMSLRCGDRLGSKIVGFWLDETRHEYVHAGMGDARKQYVTTILH
jgi:hypothetical protein